MNECPTGVADYELNVFQKYFENPQQEAVIRKTRYFGNKKRAVIVL